MTNYTAGHELNSGRTGDNRFQYADQHIEVDNRLSWFLGNLERRFGDSAYYVHLHRNPEATAQSFNNRWGLRDSIVDAFAYGICQRNTRIQKNERLDYCRFLVDCVNQNIKSFLENKSKVLDIPLSEAAAKFEVFWKEIGAEGDMNAGIGEWSVKHNKSFGGDKVGLIRQIGRSIKKYI